MANKNVPLYREKSKTIKIHEIEKEKKFDNLKVYNF